MSETNYIRVKEDNDKCCFVVDRELGVKIIAVCTCLTALRYIGFALDLSAFNDNVYVLGYILCLVPTCIAAWYFVQFLMKDEASTRDKLPKACTYVIYSSVAQCIWIGCYWTIGFGQSFILRWYLRVCWNQIILCLLYSYYTGVCVRHAQKNLGLF